MRGRFFVLDASYEFDGDQTLNILLVKTEKGDKAFLLDKGFQPYFFVDAVDVEKTVQILQSYEGFAGFERAEKVVASKATQVLKVFGKKPSDLPKMRDLIKHKPIINECYEHNLNHYKRYLRDRGISPASWIEADVKEFGAKIPGYPEFPVYEIQSIQQVERGRFPDLKVMAFDIEFVDGQIVLLSFATSPSDVFVFANSQADGADECFEGEKELIKGFLKVVREYSPDVIAGYNSDGFDLDIIREKIKTYRIKEPFLKGGSELKWVRRGRGYAGRIEGTVHIDLFPFVQNILAPQLQSEVLTLNEVASEIVGVGKEEIGYEKIIMLWRNGPRKELVEYSRNDAFITYKLAEALMPQILSLASISGETPFDAVRETYGLLVDNYLVKKTADFNAVALNLPKQEEINERRKKEPYTGGYVIEPKPGLHEGLAVFDFRSLYPSIIVTFNISPETFNCQCCRNSEEAHKVPETGYWFCSKKKGFIAACVEEVLKKRIELKEKMKEMREDEQEYLFVKEMQGALKVLANASYGYLAYAGARWYCRECAESCAAFGRSFIKEAIEIAENYGEVVYGDTDSLFVKITNEGKILEFLSVVNQALPGLLELEFQGFYEKGLFSFTREKRAAKKRYALLDKQGRMVVRGFEAVRKDWCDLAKKLQREALEYVMKGEVEKALEKVRQTVRKVKLREVELKELSMVAQLGKELHEYRQKTPHAVAASKLIKRGYDVSKGEQIRFVIVKGEGSIADRAEPLEFVDKDSYDVEYYLKHQIYPAAMRVLEVVGFKEEDIDKDLKREEKGYTLF